MSIRSVIRSIEDFELENKRVLMRLDLNVPLEERDGVQVVTDDNRITEALPTLKYALSKRARVIVASHLGRPDGKVNPALSLEPIAARVSELLGIDVGLADDCVGDGVDMLVKDLKAGQVIFLENLRFHAEEEENDPGFASDLASLADIYINDAFGTAHRKHASTYGVAQVMHHKGMGYLIEKELQFMDKILNKPERPFYAVLGGSKVTDKIKTIEALMVRTQGLVIGGAMAHAFWAVTKKEIPADAKQPKAADVEAAAAIIKTAKAKDLPLLLPVDTNLGFDIGPKSIELFGDFLSKAKTVFWNGPLGWFEKPEYSAGTFEIAKRLAETKAVKVVGGGDTVSAIKQSGYASQFDHLSTGGGAVLEYLENGSLPGIDIIKTYPKPRVAPEAAVGGTDPDDGMSGDHFS